MEVAQKDPAGADQSDPASLPLRITALLIEDNPADARLIQYMLTESGDGIFQLEHVDRLQQGLKRMESPGIDIVLSDLSLPDSHGLETFTRLHAQAPRVPIIVLSGLNDTTVAVNAVHEGAQDFLVKGQVDGPSLARAIRYAIE
ncbi:MAG TPA: response regulator, partial [Verrucomicrobiae bacterium]